MLVLKRIIHQNEWIRCNVSGEIMTHGQYYYEDDEDGFIVDAFVYKEMKDAKKAEEFDYSIIENAASEREYREALRQYEREFKTSTLLDRKVLGKDF